MLRDVRYTDGILGPHEIGVMLAIFLFGLVTIQAFTYFQSYPDDPRGVKYLVGFVWTLLLAHTITSSFSIYRRTVTRYGLKKDLEKYPEGLCLAFSFSGVIGATVQSFFAYRLRKLSGQSIIAVTCWILSAIRVISIISISVTTCHAKTVEQYAADFAWLVITSLSISAFVDVMIAIALSYCLYIRRNDVFKHAQRVVDKLIAWTIQTGALTSICSIVMLVLYVAMSNFAWMAAYHIISGLFANYLLASLNAREALRNRMNQKPTFLDMMSFQERPQEGLQTITAQSVTVEISNTPMITHNRVERLPRVMSLRAHKHLDLERGNSFATQ